MLRISLLLLLGAVGLMAQFDIDYVPAGLVSYLEITDAQRRQIVQLNSGFERFRGAKEVRSSQVQAEIDSEIREPNPDAMALGLRYRELEAIRREIEAEQTRTVESVQAVLTAAQKQKLAALQEVLRMQSTACEAVNYNLMPPPPAALSRAVLPASRIVPIYSGLVFSGSTCGGIQGQFSRVILGLPTQTYP